MRASIQVVKLRGLPDTVAALQAELQKLRFDTSVAHGKVGANADKLAG